MTTKKIFCISALISALGSSLTNIAISYRYLLNQDNGLEYGVLIYVVMITTLIFGTYIGHYIDRNNLKDPLTLIIGNLVQALLALIIAFVNDVYAVAAVMVLQTIVGIVSTTVTFKLLPLVFQGSALRQVNSSLGQIASIGFVFAPVFAPLMSGLSTSDSIYFLIDSATFIVAAVALAIIYRPIKHKLTETTLETPQSKGKEKLLYAYKTLFQIDGAKELFLGSFLYLISSTAMAIALAFIAKDVTNSDIHLYSLPIIAMFSGRMIGFQALKSQKIKHTDSQLFSTGCLLSGLLIIPLSFITNIWILSLVEFLLGASLAVAMFGEKNTLQLTFDNCHLGKVKTVRNNGAAIAKLISVPFILFLFQSDMPELVSTALGLFLILSGLIVSKAVVGVAGFAKATK